MKLLLKTTRLDLAEEYMGVHLKIGNIFILTINEKKLETIRNNNYKELYHKDITTCKNY